MKNMIKNTLKKLVCPLEKCHCDGYLRIGDRVRLHSGDYNLETPVEKLGGLLKNNLHAMSQEWNLDCIEWHQPRLPKKEIMRQLHMLLLDDEIDTVFTENLKKLSPVDQIFPGKIIEQLENSLINVD